MQFLFPISIFLLLFLFYFLFVLLLMLSLPVLEIVLLETELYKLIKVFF